MDLTGKCKEDFLNSIPITEEMLLCAYTEREITSLIIEFFDSVEYNEIWSLWDFSFKKVFHTNLHLSILQIQEQAIKKANEIFNNLFLPK